MSLGIKFYPVHPGNMADAQIRDNGETTDLIALLQDKIVSLY